MNVSLPQSLSKTLYVLLAILKLVRIVYVESCTMLKMGSCVKHVDSNCKVMGSLAFRQKKQENGKLSIRSFNVNFLSLICLHGSGKGELHIGELHIGKEFWVQIILHVTLVGMMEKK